MKEADFHMLIIPTYVASSGIHGLGVFAGQKIKQGERVWTFDPLWDHIIPDEVYAALPAASQKFLKIYAYHNRLHGPGYIVESDNGRFMNHNDKPNLDFTDGDGFALTDIPRGAELTCDYKQCCEECMERLPFRKVRDAGFATTAG